MMTTTDTIEATAVDVDLSLTTEDELECSSSNCSNVATGYAIPQPCGCEFELCEKCLRLWHAWSVSSHRMSYQCEGHPMAHAVPVTMHDVTFRSLR